MLIKVIGGRKKNDRMRESRNLRADPEENRNIKGALIEEVIRYQGTIQETQLYFET